ncbi:MAG: hypothetical protein ACI4CS_01865 [Candidatus Weimeria sp.]
MTKPIGVSEYKLVDVLPDDIKENFPSTEEIETRILDKYKCD